MSKETEDHVNVLDEPMHGIYIPAALYLVGVAITTYMSGELRILWSLPVLFIIMFTRAYTAYKRRRSLYPNKWTALELEDQTLISKNTALYRFKLKTRLESLDIPAGHHVAVRVPIDGKDEIRYYNPISSKLEDGHLDLVVKTYVDGKVSRYFAGLSTGDTVDFMGPIGTLNYEPNSSRHLGIVAGGSGITPVLQILNEVVTVPEDLTKVSLLYANETENDILLKEELDEMAEKYPHLQIHYVVHYPTDTWTGDVGYITKDQMNRYLPEYSEDNRLLICGPDGMNNLALQYAKELGWKVNSTRSSGDDQVFVF